MAFTVQPLVEARSLPFGKLRNRLSKGPSGGVFRRNGYFDRLSSRFDRRLVSLPNHSSRNGLSSTYDE
ncbi:MAG: hypothetical protein LBS86_01950 [Treponema sp.]|nr:hypothetical protein [Treponema sp.]